MRRLTLGILGSGRGSNCRAILEAIASGRLNAEVGLIVSDNPEAGILDIATEFAVPGIYLPPGKFRTKLESSVESSMVKLLCASGVDIVVLAGFMRIVKHELLAAFPRRIVNIHPSLLPKYPGLNAWTQALVAGEKVTGCTVHYVDAGVDSGEIIAQREVPIRFDDTSESLHTRIQVAERQLYPAILQSLCEPAASRH